MKNGLTGLNPWRRNRAKRLEQYLETESHEWMDAIEHHRKERYAKERQIDLVLHHERREGSNWLENREMRISDMVLEHVRMLIAARINIRKRLALECPEMLSDTELSKLERSYNTTSLLSGFHVWLWPRPIPARRLLCGAASRRAAS
jgi:hypothetical protein